MGDKICPFINGKCIKDKCRFSGIRTERKDNTHITLNITARASLIEEPECNQIVAIKTIENIKYNIEILSIKKKGKERENIALAVSVADFEVVIQEISFEEISYCKVDDALDLY